VTRGKSARPKSRLLVNSISVAQKLRDLAPAAHPRHPPKAVEVVDDAEEGEEV